MNREPNYTLGRGELHFAEFPNGVFTPTPERWRYLGNSPGFSVNIESEKLDHYDSDHGIREKDASITLETSRTCEVTLDDIQFDNLRMVFLGSTTPVTQVAAAGQTYTITGAVPGYGYQIGASATNPLGVRHISNVSVTLGATTLTEGTDYTVNLANGYLEVLLGGAVPATGGDLTVTYDVAAGTYNTAVSGTQAVAGALRYISFNPRGEQISLYMPKVEFSPSGAVDFKSDEWMTLPFQVEILKPAGMEAIYLEGALTI